MANRWMRTRDQVGAPIRAGDRVVTPVSRATIVTAPGVPVGLVWNRPAGILVNGDEERETYVRIRDHTREALFALYGVGLLTALLMWRGNKR